MSFAEDQHPVGDLGPGGDHEPLHMHSRGDSGGIFIAWMPAPARPASKDAVNRQYRRWSVRAFLAPHRPHTVGEVAKALGRSAGAACNALTTLADRAEAARITGKPLRYEANSATAAITPKAPSPSKSASAAPPAAPKPAATSAPKVPAPKAAPGPVTRPGGQVYRPRVCSTAGRAKSRQQITSRLGHGGHSREGVSGPIRPIPAHVAPAVVSCAHLTAAASLAAVARQPVSPQWHSIVQPRRRRRSL